MHSKLYWLNPDHILYWKLSGEISAVEISEMSRFIIRMVNKRPNIQVVHLIIDAAGISKISYANLEARSEFALLAKQTWMGQVVTLIHNFQIQMQINAMSTAFGMKWKNVRSMQHAIRTLKRHDGTVHNVLALKQANLIKRPRITSK